MIEIAPLYTALPEAVEALLDAAFGMDRKVRTAYKLRQGVAALPGLSFAARDAGKLIGTLQSWPVALETSDALVPLILVGPVAVMPELQRSGVGKMLMAYMLSRADNGPHDALMLIGDPEYYDRLFGFTAAATAGWELPGPVERHRLLARIRRLGGLPSIGQIIPDPGFASGTASA